MKHGESPTLMDLTAALKITKQAMSQRLNRARAAGIVGRRPGPIEDDGRPLVRWYATAAGKELL